MEPNTIAIEPLTGWGGLKTSQSKIAFQWLYYQDKQLGANKIRHSRNGGEQVILLNNGKVKVDGYDPATKTVYEFHGCQFHGCKKCKPNNRHVTTFHHPDRTVDEMYQATKVKTKLIREAGYTVIEKWECQFKKELKMDEDMKATVTKMTWTLQLIPTEAFFGGRTGLTACYYEAKESEKIGYKDFTSLYPSINKYGTYLIGHPIIIVKPSDQEISHYFGIAKVDFLAPEQLFHPVLPIRLNDKLLFTLCRQCAEDQQSLPWYERQNTCPHTDAERMLHGTWCTVELQKAVELGYRITNIHEVWHFPENQRQKGLYVNKFLKAKQESAGWPKECVTEEQKSTYMQQYKKREGITLNTIEKNPGRKAVVKLMLNR